MVVELGTPVCLGETWTLPAHCSIHPYSCFVLSGLFCLFIACVLGAPFQLRFLPFPEQPESPLEVCWQQLGIELELDFHKLIQSQFSVCRQLTLCSLLMSKLAAQPYLLLTYIWVRACPRAFCSAHFMAQPWPSGAVFKIFSFVSGLLGNSFDCHLQPRSRRTEFWELSLLKFLWSISVH